MKILWYEPSPQVMKRIFHGVHDPAIVKMIDYTGRCTQHSAGSVSGHATVYVNPTGHNLMRVEFDKDDRVSDLKELMDAFKLSAEIKLEEWKQKHGMAV